MDLCLKLLLDDWAAQQHLRGKTQYVSDGKENKRTCSESHKQKDQLHLIFFFLKRELCVEAAVHVPQDVHRCLLILFILTERQDESSQQRNNGT